MVISPVLPVNNFSQTSIVTSLTSLDESYSTPERLPTLVEKILKFYGELHFDMKGQKTDYSVKELMLRFDRGKTAISDALSYSHERGWLNKVGGGCRNAWRGITGEGFSKLESQPGHQTGHQINVRPYIDLSEQEKDIKILEKAQSCGQVIVEQPPDSYEEEAIKCLDKLAEKTSVSFLDRHLVTKAIKNAPIGPVRKFNLAKRIIRAVMKKGPIKHFKSYIINSLRKEIQDVKVISELALKHSLKVNFYAEMNC